MESRGASVELILSAALSALVLVFGAVLGHLSIEVTITACVVILCSVTLGVLIATRILDRRAVHNTSDPESLEARLAMISAELNYLTRTLPTYLITDQEYSRIESAKPTVRVVICKGEMGLEFDPDPSRRPKLPYDQIVRKNIARGVRYQWISQNTEKNKIRADIIRKLFPADSARVSLLNGKEWQELPFSLETVFITTIFNGSEKVDAYLQIPVEDLEAERYWIKVDPDRRDEWQGRAVRYMNGTSHGDSGTPQ